MGEFIMRIWDLREFRVQINLQSPTQQVRVPIRRVMTPIRGLPNPIRQVVPLISHIRSYPPHRSHLHPPSPSFSSTTLTSLQNTKLSSPTLLLHVMIMSWHRVQHTPSTQHCLSSLDSHDYKLTPECSFSFRHASPHDRPPSASSPWELKVEVTLSHAHSCKFTNWWIESQHPVRHPSTASKYSSKLAQSHPPSVSLNSLNYGLPVHLQTRSITASKCISKLARSRPPSVSPNSLQYCLQVHTIMASTCSSKLARPQHPCLCLNLHDYNLQVRTITASKFISKLVRSWPRSASLSWLDRHFHVHLGLLSSTACSQSRYTVCKSEAIWIHRWEYKLNTWVLIIVER